MELSLEKVKEQYKLFIVNEDGKREKFEYIEFINLLYDSKEINNIKYDSNITENEKKQIDKMINDINEIVKQNS